MDDSGVTVVTQPAVEAVTLAEAKVQVRVEADFTADDGRLRALISAARMRVEYETGLVLINTVFRIALPAFPDGGEDIQLPWSPLVPLDADDAPLTSITYTDANGDDQSLTIDADYAVAEGRVPPRIATLASTGLWPATAVTPNAVRVTWTAGHAVAGLDVPAPLRQAVLMLLGHWYEDRRLVVIGRSAPMPYGIDYLLAPFSDGRY